MMTVKHNYLTLGPAALNILALEKKTRTKESRERRKELQATEFIDLVSDEEFEQDLTDRAELLNKIESTVVEFLYDYTPVDTGNLLDALYTYNDGMTLTIGFDMHKAPYAVYQHEDFTLHHSTGRAKYLQQAVLEAMLLCDPQQRLNVNMTIQGLHAGGKLEAQIGYTGLKNFNAALGERRREGISADSIASRFGHDFYSEVSQQMQINTEVGLADDDNIFNYVNRKNFSYLNSAAGQRTKTMQEFQSLVSHNEAIDALKTLIAKHDKKNAAVVLSLIYNQQGLSYSRIKKKAQYLKRNMT